MFKWRAPTSLPSLFLAALLIWTVAGCVDPVVKKVVDLTTDGDTEPDGVTDVFDEVQDAVEPPDGGNEIPDVPRGDDTSDALFEVETIGPEVANEVVPQPEYVVGPDGGEFVFDNGAGIVVPAGALSKDVTIALAVSEEKLPDDVEAVTALWGLSPAGTKFSVPVTLKLPIIDNDLVDSQWPLVRGFVGEAGDFEEVSAWPNLVDQQAWLQTSHFSGACAGLKIQDTDCLSYELCDGLDNDCDGKTDESGGLDTSDLMTGCKTKGVCAGQVEAQCVQGAWTCVVKNTISEFYEPDGETLCDAHDNDCDGLVNEDLHGKLSELFELGVSEVSCKQAGLCADAVVSAACNKGKWICDYSKVSGFQGGAELTCDKIDNDCDGLVDEATCTQYEECLSDEACVFGHCVHPLENSELTFCTEAPDSCLAVDEEANLVEVPVDGTWCVSDELHWSDCEGGAWTDPLHCELKAPLNPKCDLTLNYCTGGCLVDEDCEDNGDVCDGTPICQDAQCVIPEDFVAPSCADLDWVCEVFECDPVSGECVGSAKGNGLPCDDGNLCTGSGTCAEGDCAQGVEIDCEDGEMCTVDSCDIENGECVHDPEGMVAAQCNDFSLCTTNDVCQEDGSCAGKAKLCDDGNPCTLNSCIAETGVCDYVQTPGDACDDGNPCTEVGYCDASAQCIAEPIDCSDHNDCTVDSCMVGVCKNVPGLPDASCVYPDAVPGNQDNCIPLGKCDGAGACMAGTDYCECHNDADCIALDEDLCDGGATCELTGKLLLCEEHPETAVVCDPAANTQCRVNTCRPDTGLCEMTDLEDGTWCSDDDACTVNDGCSAGECLGPDPFVCNDKKVCTNDLCDPAEGCQFVPLETGTPCQDADPCTLNDQCDDVGACLSGPQKDPPCLDDDLCTIDTCSPDGLECLFVPIEGCCTDASDCDEEAGEVCNVDTCCLPECADDSGNLYQCGLDGCGDVCGLCPEEAVCFEHFCCVPNCTNPEKTCGDDGCGGSCGDCPGAEICTGDFQCCLPTCGDKECGNDGCGGSCGACFPGEICNQLSGSCETCYPDCDGKQCGQDGCGGQCGQCEEAQVCLGGGTCCTPGCDGKTCGDDGCGGSCGGCLDWQKCEDFACVCAQCCEDIDDCGPLQTCTGTVEDEGEIESICENPPLIFAEDFEGQAAGAPSPSFSYSWKSGIPWQVKKDALGLIPYAGDYYFRYYRVWPDDGWFWFKRVLPTVAQDEFSTISFYGKCTVELEFALQVYVGSQQVLNITQGACDGKWRRYTADLSAMSGAKEIKFKMLKATDKAVDFYIDELALMVSKCPDDVECATFAVESGVCELDSLVSDFCFINYECVAQDEVHPDIECAVCKSVEAPYVWSPDDELCNDNDPMTADICDLGDTQGCFHN